MAAGATHRPLVCRACLNPGGALVTPCCCTGGIHPACLEKEKLYSRYSGFCDACGELFSEEPPVLATGATAAAGAAPNRPSRPPNALTAVVAAAGLLAVGGTLAYLAGSGGERSRHSKHSGHTSKRSRLRPASRRGTAPAAAAKQAANGKSAEQGGGRTASRRGPAPSSKGRSTAESMLVMSRLNCLFLGAAAALNFAEAAK